jgi:hypothetical protein
MPAQHARPRAGEHLLFMAGIPSDLAKKGGGALSDVERCDVDRTWRYLGPAEIPTGSELVSIVWSDSD